ncbi:uncharacterized protein [Rutidosis leptorrhynchoides]|uniref:uncharacterized protein n=1 Tax=Rutidosis leptorrhynchoides TaxID=125765 RepID=UPI003A98E6E3
MYGVVGERNRLTLRPVVSAPIQPRWIPCGTTKTPSNSRIVAFPAGVLPVLGLVQREAQRPFWPRKNCPIAWQGQYTRGDQKGPSIMLEVVASQDLWIWHALFGMACANNDINVLNYSPLFNTIKEGTAPPSPFNVNGHHYERGYYLGAGIYPDWAMLVKAPHNPIDEQRKKFKRFQESARKDNERAFGVLQCRFAMLKTPARSMDFNKIRRHMYACVVLHNMIQENNGL